VIFAPAGVGVREVLLITLLTPAIGAGAATAVALVSRAVTTAGDLLVAGAAAARRRPAAPPDDGSLSDPVSHNASSGGSRD